MLLKVKELNKNLNVEHLRICETTHNKRCHSSLNKVLTVTNPSHWVYCNPIFEHSQVEAKKPNEHGDDDIMNKSMEIEKFDPKQGVPYNIDYCGGGNDSPNSLVPWKTMEVHKKENELPRLRTNLDLGERIARSFSCPLLDGVECFDELGRPLEKAEEIYEREININRLTSFYDY